MPRRFIKTAAVLSIAVAASLSAPKPVEAGHFTIINGLCFNPATNPATGVPITNPHCVVSVPDTPPPVEGGGEEGPKAKKSSSNSDNSSAGKIVVGCVMLAATGLIVASVAKAKAMGFQYRWMSQAEFERDLATRDRRYELTAQEAATIGFTCGIGAVPVIWNYRR